MLECVTHPLLGVAAQPRQNSVGGIMESEEGHASDTTSRYLRTISDLAASGLVSNIELAALGEVIDKFSLSVSPAMRAAMLEASSADPIYRQFIPSIEENKIAEEELVDPIGDETHSPTPGIVHRYPDRVLLKVTNSCPVYCRFCFRRERVGRHDETISKQELHTALNYIANNEDVWEVILTGGDPLLLSPRRLGPIIEHLTAIPHVKVIRLHSRVPIVTPQSISDELVSILDCNKAVYLVLHCNHYQEISEDTREACRRLSRSGIVMLSQTVLLRDVNDTAADLTRLFRELVAIRVKPYYLHHGDLARGTSHFRTTLEAGRQLMREIRGTISGLCQPTYVLDIPGGYGKVPVGPDYLVLDAQHGWRVEDPWGEVHEYDVPGAETG